MEVKFAFWLLDKYMYSLLVVPMHIWYISLTVNRLASWCIEILKNLVAYFNLGANCKGTLHYVHEDYTCMH